MDAGMHIRLLLLPLVLGGTLAWASPPQYVASRDIVVACDAANGAPVSKVELWVSADAGRTWQSALAVPCGEHAVRFSAPADGKYDFYVVLHNPAGASTDPPGPGSPPAATTIVDTVAPLLQIHATEVQRTDGGAWSVSLKASLIDENLSPSGIRVFYRTAGQKWTDGGPATRADRRIVWTPPASAGPLMDLRVVATDLAGNRSVADVLDVTIPASPESASVEKATTRPATSAETRGAAHGLELASDVSLADTDDVPRLAAAPEVQRLCGQADRFMGEGHYSLAAARFEDAVGVAPRDADLLARLGTALFRAGRHDEAGARFREALGSNVNHAGALEGLALVAVTQKQYAQAREYMRQLQRLEPKSGNVWLRSGDIEHRLGNTPQALDAWRCVLVVAGTDKDLREKAQRRLDYFSPQRRDDGKSPVTNDLWPELPSSRPSSSSAETNPTKRPSP
jgi:Flp pilus assembly protein TadD